MAEGWFFSPMTTIRPAGQASWTHCSKDDGIHTVSTITGIPSPPVNLLRHSEPENAMLLKNNLEQQEYEEIAEIVRTSVKKVKEAESEMLNIK